MVVHGPYPLGEPRVEREALAARAAGWQVEVLAMRRVGEAAEEQVDGVLVRRLPIEHRRGAGFAAALREYVGFTCLATRELALGPRREVVHVHAPPDFLIGAALPARLRGAHVILDIHDLSSHMFAMRFGDRPDRRCRTAPPSCRSGGGSVSGRGGHGARAVPCRARAPRHLAGKAHGVDEQRRRVASASCRLGIAREGFGRLPRDDHASLRSRPARQGGSAGGGALEGLRLELYGEGDELPGVRGSPRSWGSWPADHE